MLAVAAFDLDRCGSQAMRAASRASCCRTSVPGGRAGCRGGPRASQPGGGRPPPPRRRGELVTADTAAQQADARALGLPAGPYVPDGVAGEYCLFGRHADPLQGHLDQVWGGLARLDIPGRKCRVDRVLGVQGSAQRM